MLFTMFSRRFNFSIEEKNMPAKFLIVRSFFILALIFILFLFFGCGITDSNETELVFEYDFSESQYAWEPFFTDYNVGWGDKMQLTSDYRTLPEPLNTDQKAHFISADNHSDDVKMLFRRQVSANLEPNTLYSVQYTVRFATEVPSGCAGIGGAPGEAVRVIADASFLKPEPIVEDDYYLLNIQHEEDSFEWYQNVQMGDIANSRECEEGYEYEIKEVSSGPNHARVATNESGQAWLMFGTRSGFEGQTDLYYTYFRAEFREM